MSEPMTTSRRVPVPRAVPSAIEDGIRAAVTPLNNAKTARIAA
jgi:hypothetical protein